MEYDPLVHPLELPVQQLTVQCRAGQPLYFAPHNGSTPGTTLYGAFGNAVWASACKRGKDYQTLCNYNPPECSQPEKCIIPWLFKPYSTVQRRTLARPVLIQAPALEQMQPVESFNLQVTLWGRHAIQAHDTVITTLAEMGRVGLQDSSDRRIGYAIEHIDTEDFFTLGQRLEALQNTYWQQALLRFRTPFLHREPVVQDDGKREKLFFAAGELPLAKILGNIAYELVAWDLEDRGPHGDTDSSRHDLARQARYAAQESVAEIAVNADLQPVRIGQRRSKSNGHAFFIEGFVGDVELSGDINAALPWLLTLSLMGGGQKRAMGFGSVGFWLGAAPLTNNV